MTVMMMTTAALAISKVSVEMPCPGVGATVGLETAIAVAVGAGV